MTTSWQMYKVNNLVWGQYASLGLFRICQHTCIIIPHETRDCLIPHCLIACNKIETIIDEMKTNEEYSSYGNT